jgi:elongation factor Ts
MIPIEKIKKLRQETSLSISQCKKALEKAKGDLEKAKEILKEWGEKFAQTQQKKETKEGVIASYVHPNKRIGVLLEICCESDFVAKSEEFQKLAHEICLQIAAMGERDLLSQPWIKDETKKIGDLIKEHIAKFGENITIKRFCRYEL